MVSTGDCAMQFLNNIYRRGGRSQEEAQESVDVDYQGEQLEIGFNVGYLLDVLNAVDEEAVRLSLTDANSSSLIEASTDKEQATTAKYVVMPMRL